MKKGASQLRLQKLERLKGFQPVNKLTEVRSPSRSVLQVLNQKGSTSICAEIHQSASYNGSGFSMRLEELTSIYDKYADVIVIATDNLLFGEGKLSWLSTIKANTHRPVVALDLFLTRDQITEAYNRGADAIILIVSLLELIELEELVSHAKTLGLEVIVEVQDEDEIGMVQSVQYDAVSINTRDIENLADIDMHKLHRLRPLVPVDKPIIAASGIKTNYDIQRYCIGCNGVLIGSAILESYDPEQSLVYFKGGSEQYPFIWVRPAAFLFPERIIRLRNSLFEAGFVVQHSFKVHNTKKVFAAMYSHKFRQMIEEGRRYYTAMAESLRQIALRGGNPDYSEVWMLHSEFDLVSAYEQLLSVKANIRKNESLPITTIWVDGFDMPVQLHSIHSPDASLYHHYRDLAVVSSFREHQLELGDYV